MAERYPGGVISKTPPTVTPPVAGEGGSASGMWTLDTVLEYEKAGAWPKPVLPRELYAWGYNGKGSVGDGTSVNRSSPTQIGALITWKNAGAGRYFSFSVKTDGTLWSWGYNGAGQLGQNIDFATALSKSSPVQVGSLTNWSDSQGGGDHSISLKTDGTLWTWGRAVEGQVGDNATVNRSSPVQVGALSNWYKIAAGRNNSLATKTDGTLWSWGFNNYGQLGLNISILINRSSPVQVGSLTDWAKVAAGDYHAFAIKTNNTLWAWGRNDQGRLGDGTTTGRSSPVQIGALTNWNVISAGIDSSAAIKTDGTLWSWGENGVGQLGDGTVILKSSPIQVGSLATWSLISGGKTGSFFMAIKTDGTLWAWGNNANGQIGDGTAVRRSSPVQIGALTNWNTVAVGSRHSVVTNKG